MSNQKWVRPLTVAEHNELDSFGKGIGKNRIKAGSNVGGYTLENLLDILESEERVCDIYDILQLPCPDKLQKLEDDPLFMKAARMVLKGMHKAKD